MSTDSISVFAPPNEVDVQVDIGPQGPRGNKFYVAEGDPNTNIVTFVNDTPTLGDFYIRTDEGPEYGYFYKYSSVLGVGQWVLDFQMQEVVEQYFINNSSASSTYLTKAQADGFYITYENLADLELEDILSGANTDQLNEGSINLYHTTERAQDAVANMIINSAHTGISVNYLDSANTLSFTNTGIRNVTGQTGELSVSVDQNTKTANVRFPDVVNIPNNLVIGQDLIINGQLTFTQEANELQLEQVFTNSNEIVLNFNVEGVPVSDAFITVERGTNNNFSLKWNETTDKWQLGNKTTGIFYDIWNDNTDTISLDKVTASDGIVISAASAPTSPVIGQIYYDTVEEGLFYYDGSSWIEVGTGSGGGSAIAITDITTTTINSASATLVKSFDLTEYRSAEFFVQVSKDTNFRSSKINIVHNGTTPYLTEYAIIDIGSIPVTFSTTIQGSNVLLNAAVSNANISDTVEIKVATNVLVDV